MTGQPRDHAGVRVPPPLIFLGLVVIGPVLDSLVGLAPLAIPPTLRTVLVLILIAAGLAVVLVAVRRFASAGTRVEPWVPSSAIVSDGIYRFTRNPMYVGMAVVMLGLSLILASPASLGMVVVGVLIVDRFVIRREEAYLEAKFGEEYRTYRARVRRWL
ncbi:MAG: isoprenylcysteine carboxylmethyltransferase family protein [Sphingomicrobium sp.]